MTIEERIERIYAGLDLDFSDGGVEGENVRRDTLVDQLDDVEEALAMLNAEEAINFSLLQTLSETQPSAEIYALDFPSDLRASCYLLLGGYYRQAALQLRNWMEMRLLGIYYGLVEQNRVAYEDWKAGKATAPFGATLIDRLFARAEFQKADARVALRSRLDQLYRKLCEFTHGGGLEKHDLQRETDNVPRYNRQSVSLWLSLMHETYAEVVFCLFTAYGEKAFRCAGAESAWLVVKHLPRQYEQMVREVVRIP